VSRAVVISKAPRDGDMIEVTLSKDGTRFTAHIPAALDDTPEADVIYQRMAQTVADQADRVRNIIQANRSV
jgi:hypothetical protein